MEVQRKYTQLVAKAWSDEEFKQRLIADPSTVLREEGINVPDRVEVRVVENSSRVFYLSLPPRPTTELSDEQLDLVSGGLFDIRDLFD